MRGSKRADLLRLRAILLRLVAPFEETDEDITTEEKLWYVLNPSEFPIYRRKITKPMPVHGLWWYDEAEWVHFAWQGHSDAEIINSGQGQYKVLTTRRFEPGGWCYIRETGPDQIDIEAMTRTTGWDPKRKRKMGTRREWLTVSCTREKYKMLDSFLGPIDDGCKHTEEFFYDYPSE